MIRTLKKSIREYKTASILSVLFIVFEVAIECALPFITSKLVDQMNDSNNNTQNESYFPHINFNSEVINEKRTNIRKKKKNRRRNKKNKKWGNKTKRKRNKRKRKWKKIYAINEIKIKTNSRKNKRIIDIHYLDTYLSLH